ERALDDGAARPLRVLRHRGADPAQSGPPRDPTRGAPAGRAAARPGRRGPHAPPHAARNHPARDGLHCGGGRRLSAGPTDSPCGERQAVDVGGTGMLAQQIVSGLATGSLYALTAIGIVLIFRNTRTINLAQGDFSMIGAFVALVILEHSEIGRASCRERV